MHRYEIKNRNGSTVFVDGVRVGPHTTLTASLDPMTAKELSKYGVSLVVVTPPSPPAEEAPVEVSAPEFLVEDIVAASQELAIEEEASPEEAPVEVQSEVVEEAPAEEPIPAAEAEEAPTAEESEETPSEAVVSDEAAEPTTEATSGESSEDSGRRKKKNKNR